MMTHKIMIAPPRRRNTYLVIVTILHKSLSVLLYYIMKLISWITSLHLQKALHNVQ